MNFLNTWLQGIIISVVIATIIEMIIPNGNNKKYVKIVLGFYVVFNIITPVINQLSNNNFEIASILNIEKYEKQIEAYTATYGNNISIEENNEKSIEQIYISNLKKDIKAKLKEKDFLVKDIKIKLSEDQQYIIKSLELNLEKKENKNNEEKNKEQTEEKDKLNINEIEIVNIEIENKNNIKVKEDNKDNTNNNKKNSLTTKDKEEVIKYIKSVYEIKENQINIY